MSLILDGTKGETFPTWTTGTRPTTPNTGQTGYNTTLGILETYNGTAWVSAVVNSAGQIVASAGTAALPGITTTGDTNTGIFFPAADTIAFAEGGTESARFNNVGLFLVGTTAAIINHTIYASADGSGALSTRNTLAASGKYHNFASDQNANFRIFNQSGAGVYLADGATAWTAFSDERLKNIVSEISNAADKINTLRAVNFTWKSDDENTPHVGLIAQDVQKVLPEAVTENDGHLGVAYTDVIPLLVASIKELSAKLDAAEARIAALEGAK